MRAREFLDEAVTRANELDHFRNRIDTAAKLCANLGDHPLVYRAFKHNKYMTLLAKVDHTDAKNPQVRKGGVGAQEQLAIIRQLGIEHPTFCRMKPPSDAAGFHGMENIFIPTGDVTPYWSPRIRDLGGIDYIRDTGEYHQSHLPVPGMPGVYKGNPGELDQTERWAKTYQHAWPASMTDHELIFDCATYYLLDMEIFFTKFAGKKLKGMIDANPRSMSKPIKPEAFDRLKTYSDVAWYLNNTAVGYLDWWQYELPKIKAAKSTAQYPVNEISRLPKKDAGDFGDKGTIVAPKHAVKKNPLPGGSKFTYAVDQTGQGDIEIMIFDGETIAAELDLFETQDVTDAWRVETVVVDPDYRGQGLGKALYGIALSILRLTVEAGDAQTRHGQQMWLMLNSIPGVEVVGYNMEPTDKYKPHKGDKIVKQDADWTRYTFPVKPGSSSMRSGRRGTGIYTSQASMLARWTGR